jgi:hypothetical protein
MKILFCMRHEGYFRLFGSPIELLLRRGHRVHLAFETQKYRSDSLARLIDAYPNLTCGIAPPRERDHWTAFLQHVRGTRDYLRYLGPRYEDASKLRQRARLRVPRPVRPLLRLPAVSTPAALRTLDHLLGAVEDAVPEGRATKRFIAEHEPDIVVVTPLVALMPSVKSHALGSAQFDYLRCSRALGIPTCLCVASWDHLTNKGLIRGDPDVVTVWNEAQKQEAVELHGVPAERVVVTGAPSFDEWFERKPSTTREEFCRAVGLRPDRPIVVYVGSSPFIAPDEPAYVERWIRELRGACGEALVDVGILIRPHPQNALPWAEAGLEQHGQVAVWPRPDSDAQVTRKADWSEAEFYDSIHHSAAVVGVNTTAMIESAVIGRGVYTVLAPEFKHTQHGTLHFRYLLRVRGGLIKTAATFEEHVAQLADALAGGTPSENGNRRFLEAFVRPHGLGVPATPILVRAIEDASRAAPDSLAPRPEGARTLRRALAPLVALFYRPRRDAAFLLGRLLPRGSGRSLIPRNLRCAREPGAENVSRAGGRRAPQASASAGGSDSLAGATDGARHAIDRSPEATAELVQEPEGNIADGDQKSRSPTH